MRPEQPPVNAPVSTRSPSGSASAASVSASVKRTRFGATTVNGSAIESSLASNSLSFHGSAASFAWHAGIGAGR